MRATIVVKILVSIRVVFGAERVSGMRSFVKCDGFFEAEAVFFAGVFFTTGALTFADTVFLGDVVFVFLGAVFFAGVFLVPVDVFFAGVFFFGSAIRKRNEIIHQRYSSLGLFKASNRKIEMTKNNCLGNYIL